MNFAIGFLFGFCSCILIKKFKVIKYHLNSLINIFKR